MTAVNPTILFVDKDADISQTMTTLLRDEEWTLLFSNTTADAVATLKEQPVDVIIADTDFEDGNGVGLLNIAKQQHPAVIRIYLTAFSSQSAVTKALAEGTAQQLIAKPWIDQEFKEIIRSAIRQMEQQKKRSAEFQQLINSIPRLPSLPESYNNVRSCITSDDIDIEKMAEYISQDVALTSVLLRWANSALFGQRFQVDTIKKAIIVLGTDIVENLILSEAVNSAITAKKVKVKGFDLKQLKKHSMATACLSRLLIKSIYPADTMRHDRAFVAGLLHDMGKLVAASFLPQQFEQAIRFAKQEKTPLTEAERQIYSTDHAELGGFLAEWWALPPFIVNAIYWHHAPQQTPIEQDIIMAAFAANLLSYSFSYGSNGEPLQRELPTEVINKFFLTDEAIEILRMETEKIIRVLVR